MSHLADVKVGDLLINEFRGGSNVVKVVRLTPTLIIVTNEQKYYKKNGHKVGNNSAFYYDTIHIPTEGEVEFVRQRNTINNVCRLAERILSYRNISYEQAVKIKEILNL